MPNFVYLKDNDLFLNMDFVISFQPDLDDPDDPGDYCLQTTHDTYVINHNSPDFETLIAAMKTIEVPCKAPSFRAQHGRDPIPGTDFDPNQTLSEDEYNYLSGKGNYCDYITKLSAKDYSDLEDE